jgi:hypothetical protein
MMLFALPLREKATAPAFDLSQDMAYARRTAAAGETPCAG